MVPLRPIWTIMVAAKLDQSRVLVTKFRENRLMLKGRSAGQRHTDRQTHRHTDRHTDRQTNADKGPFRFAIGPINHGYDQYSKTVSLLCPFLKDRYIIFSENVNCLHCDPPGRGSEAYKYHTIQYVLRAPKKLTVCRLNCNTKQKKTEKSNERN